MPATRKVSNAQLEALLAWMEDHPLQAPKQASISLWESLASLLNAMGDGVSKTPKEWRIMGLDVNVPSPPLPMEAMDMEPSAAENADSAEQPSTSGSSQKRPSKRRHVAPEGQNPTGPNTAAPRWVLEIENRRLREDQLRREFEERRLEDEREWRREVLGALRDIAHALLSHPPPPPPPEFE
ncbi:hypothetical protein evm_014357 [Chilo suppressalis]|nr:hypothetical protein evm_014357 [Chilo suppressalis]